MLPKLIWRTLSAINVNEHVEKKQGLSYLSWAWAWGVMCEHFPDTTYTFDSEEFPDGSVEYVCTVTVKHEGQQHSQTMWLPVMDHRNKAVKHPDAFARNTCKMRCLVKTLSMMGLGHYIYAGEDLPAGQDVETIDEKQQKLVHDLLVETGSDLQQFLLAFKVKAIADLTPESYNRALAIFKKKLASQEENGDA